jgi:hypothetical protein
MSDENLGSGCLKDDVKNMRDYLTIVNNPCPHINAEFLLVFFRLTHSLMELSPS